MQKIKKENGNFEDLNEDQIDLLKEISIKDSNNNTNKTFTRLINPDSVNNYSNFITTNSNVNDSNNNNNSTLLFDSFTLMNKSYFNKLKNNFKFEGELKNPNLNFPFDDNKIITINKIQNYQKTRNQLDNKNKIEAKNLKINNANANASNTQNLQTSSRPLTPIINDNDTNRENENISSVLFTNFENSLNFLLDESTINNENENRISKDNNNNVIQQFKTIDQQKFACDTYLDKYISSINTCPGIINSNPQKEERKFERSKNLINFEMIEKNLECETNKFLLDEYENENEKNFLTLDSFNKNEINCTKKLNFDKENNKDTFEEKYGMLIDGKYKINNNEKLIFSKKSEFDDSNKKQIINNINNIKTIDIDKQIYSTLNLNLNDNSNFSLRNSPPGKINKVTNNEFVLELESFDNKKKFNFNTYHKKSKSSSHNLNSNSNTNTNSKVNNKNKNGINNPNEEFELFKNDNDNDRIKFKYSSGNKLRNSEKAKEIISGILINDNNNNNDIAKLNTERKLIRSNEQILKKIKIDNDNKKDKETLEFNLNNNNDNESYSINKQNFIDSFKKFSFNSNSNLENDNMSFSLNEIKNNKKEINNSNSIEEDDHKNLPFLPKPKNSNLNKFFNNENKNLQNSEQITLTDNDNISFNKNNEYNNLYRQIETEYNIPIRGKFII